MENLRIIISYYNLHSRSCWFTYCDEITYTLSIPSGWPTVTIKPCHLTNDKVSLGELFLRWQSSSMWGFESWLDTLPMLWSNLLLPFLVSTWQYTQNTVILIFTATGTCNWVAWCILKVMWILCPSYECIQYTLLGYTTLSASHRTRAICNG
jgi:hypothetical protein